MVWVIRILLVGSLSKKSDRMTQESNQSVAAPISRRELRQAQSRAAHPSQSNRSVPAGLSNAALNQAQNTKHGYRPEPTYIPMQDEAAFHSLKPSGSTRRRV
jgi:hypothetical protein